MLEASVRPIAWQLFQHPRTILIHHIPSTRGHKALSRGPLGGVSLRIPFRVPSSGCVVRRDFLRRVPAANFAAYFPTFRSVPKPVHHMRYVNRPGPPCNSLNFWQLFELYAFAVNYAYTTKRSNFQAARSLSSSLGMVRDRVSFVNIITGLLSNLPEQIKETRLKES